MAGRGVAILSHSAHNKEPIAQKNCCLYVQTWNKPVILA